LPDHLLRSTFLTRVFLSRFSRNEEILEIEGITHSL
jgi:hypothetical protein